MEIENRVYSIRLVYVIGIIAIIIGIIVAVPKLTSNQEIAKIEAEQLQVANDVEIAKSVQQEENVINEIKLEDGNAKNINTTSRGSEETRKNIENSEDVKKESNSQNTQSKKEDNNQATQNNKENSNQITQNEKKDGNEVAQSKKESDSQTKQNKKENSNKSSQKNKESKAVEKTKTSIGDVTISIGMDLTKRTGLTREDFIKLAKKIKYDSWGFFEENAGIIYDLCEEYSINEIFFCGLISAESGWNIASNHRRTYNYISMMSRGKLIQFNSVEDGLRAGAKLLHNNYLTKGGSFYHGATLNGVQKCFCPSDSWVSLVYGRMKQVLA